MRNPTGLRTKQASLTKPVSDCAVKKVKYCYALLSEDSAASAMCAAHTQNGDTNARRAHARARTGGQGQPTPRLTLAL